MTGDWKVLAEGYDHVEWENQETLEAIASHVRQDRPLWLRVANFYEGNLAFLRLLPPNQLVLWKIEHWGSDTTHDRIPASPSMDFPAYIKRIQSLGHSIHPYTFTERNRELLYGDVPELRDMGLDILPVAQKEPIEQLGARQQIRDRLGIGPSDTLIGAGGLLHPTKGIDEIVTWFLNTVTLPNIHLFCSVVDEDEQSEADVRLRWEQMAGVSSSERLHFRLGAYGEWDWMCKFYQTVDVMLVNSISDSWGRMVSEPVGLGIPTIVRRADCATNHIMPRTTLVDSYASLTMADFDELLRSARDLVPSSADYVSRHYALPVVKGRFLEILQCHTPVEHVPALHQLASEPRSAALVAELLDH